MSSVMHKSFCTRNVFGFFFKTAVLGSVFCPAAHSFTGLLNQGLIKSLLDRRTKRGIKPGHQKGSARITHRAFEQAVSPSAQVGLPVLCPRDRG